MELSRAILKDPNELASLVNNAVRLTEDARIGIEEIWLGLGHPPIHLHPLTRPIPCHVV
jgi:hypothetical protein